MRFPLQRKRRRSRLGAVGDAAKAAVFGTPLLAAPAAWYLTADRDVDLIGCESGACNENTTYLGAAGECLGPHCVRVAELKDHGTLIQEQLPFFEKEIVPRILKHAGSRVLCPAFFEYNTTGQAEPAWVYLGPGETCPAPADGSDPFPLTDDGRATALQAFVRKQLGPHTTYLWWKRLAGDPNYSSSADAVVNSAATNAKGHAEWLATDKNIGAALAKAFAEGVPPELRFPAPDSVTCPDAILNADGECPPGVWVPVPRLANVEFRGAGQEREPVISERAEDPRRYHYVQIPIPDLTDTGAALPANHKFGADLEEREAWLAAIKRTWGRPALDFFGPRESIRDFLIKGKFDPRAVPTDRVRFLYRIPDNGITPLTDAAGDPIRRPPGYAWVTIKNDPAAGTLGDPLEDATIGPVAELVRMPDWGIPLDTPRDGWETPAGATAVDKHRTLRARFRSRRVDIRMVRRENDGNPLTPEAVRAVGCLGGANRGACRADGLVAENLLYWSPIEDRPMLVLSRAGRVEGEWRLPYRFFSETNP